MERLNIPYPSEEEIDQEVQMIVSNGLRKRPSFFTYWSTMVRDVGLRTIFRDATEIVFTVILGVLVLCTLLLISGNYIKWNDLNIYTLSFSWSPAIYFGLVYIFFIRKKEKPTFEVEMVSKYNFYALAGIRMLVFSVLGMLMNGTILLSLSVTHDYNVYGAFLLSVTSLFLFAWIYLWVQHRVSSQKIPMAMFIGWIAGNVLLSTFSEQVYRVFLEQIPFFIYGCIFLAALLLYSREIVRFVEPVHRRRSV